MDYIKLIQRLDYYDVDQDCQLSHSEFQQLAKDLGILPGELSNLCFNFFAIENKISFGSIRRLYELSFRGTKNKTMCAILFCAFDQNKDGNLNFQEFARLAHIVDPQMTDQSIHTKYNANGDEKTEISYPQVARTLFGLRIRMKSNPQKDSLRAVRSPQTSLCLLL